MATIWFVQHQNGGVMWGHPFTRQPTQEQFDAVVEEAEYKFGSKQAWHPEGEWWGAKVVEIAVHDTDVPVFVPPNSGNAKLGGDVGIVVRVGGVGTITPAPTDR